MTKPENVVTAQDLARFVAGDSDFAFEMRALVELRRLGFDCSHSGTYRDPVTDKIRQYDIRALKHSDTATLALGVECKNLRPIRPLLLSAVPRTADESFHEIVVYESHGSARAASVRRVARHESVYRTGEMVGKKTDQVSMDNHGALVSDDQVTFDKLNQALNSCQGLVRQLATKASPPLIRAIVPVLVVPSGLLWQVDYAADGILQTPPRRVEHATLFVNHAWSFDLGPVFGAVIYRISHIEIVTLGGLPTTAAGWLGNTGFFSHFLTSAG